MVTQYNILSRCTCRHSCKRHKRGAFFTFHRIKSFLTLPGNVGQVEEKLERDDNNGKGKQRGSFRKFFGSFLTPVFLEVGCQSSNLFHILGFLTLFSSETTWEKKNPKERFSNKDESLN